MKPPPRVCPIRQLPPPVFVTAQLTHSVSFLSILDTPSARSHAVRRFPQLQCSYLVELAAFSKFTAFSSIWHAPCSSSSNCNVEIFKPQPGQKSGEPRGLHRSGKTP